MKRISYAALGIAWRFSYWAFALNVIAHVIKLMGIH